MLFVLLFFVLTDVTNYSVQGETCKLIEYKFFDDGDVVIGGLFPLHSSTGEQLNVGAVMLAESMRFAINKINANNSLLPGIKLGMDIRDSRGTVQHAIQQTLEFNVSKSYTHLQDSSHGSCGSTNRNSKNKSKSVVAIVGAAISDVTIAVASLAGLFRIPVISYASTSRLLQDRQRFKYFLRTVPSDDLQVQALIDIVHYFQWTYIILIASDSEYGRSGAMSFRNRLRNLNTTKRSVCIAVDDIFTDQIPRSKIDRMMKKIKQERSAKVIVLFAHGKDARFFLEVAKEHNLVGYTWLASESWSKSQDAVEDKDDILANMIGITHVQEQNREFIDYFRTLKTNDSIMKGCELAKTRVSIEKYLSDPSSYITTTMNAVYAVAHGLHQFYKCTTHAGCPRVAAENADYTQLYDHIKNVSFVSQGGNRVRLEVENSVFSIIKFEPQRNQSDTKPRFVVVGKWSSSERLCFTKNITLPESTCSAACPRGHRRKPLLGKHPRCCWECVPCPKNKFLNETSQSCRDCPVGFKVANDLSSCSPQPMTALLYSSPSAVALLAYACFGSIAVFVTWLVYYLYRDTAVIKASSYGLSCLLLLSLLSNFITPAMLMRSTTKTLCMVNICVASTSVCVFFCTLTTKANRIARIFSRRAFQLKQVNYLHIKWQFSFISFFCFINIAIVVVWFAVTDVAADVIEYAPGYYTKSCKYDSTGAFVLLTYHVGILIVCNYQAFLIRKVPENYNEAKYMCFTTLFISFGILMYFPGRQGLKGNHRTLFICMLYLLSDTIALVGLFGPKLYIIIFRPEKNTPISPSSVVENQRGNIGTRGTPGDRGIQTLTF